MNATAHPGHSRTAPIPDSDGDLLPGIARRAVLATLAGKDESPPRFDRGPLREARPVFVTLWAPQGELRGCIGSFVSRSADVASETWRMAKEAAFSDPRFPPVAAGEMGGLRFEVSVVHELEEVTDTASLDPTRFGVVVTAGDGRRGALLPAIEGIDTVARQLALARRKGRIGPEEPIRIQRFEVDRFSEGAEPVTDRTEKGSL